MGKEDINSDLTLLKPELQELVNKIYSNIIIYNRIPMEHFETMRTLERQEWLFHEGFSKTLNSKHLNGSAVDFVYRDPETKKWSWDNNVIHYFDFLGARVLELYGDKIFWGKNFISFKDYPHFELKV